LVPSTAEDPLDENRFIQAGNGPENTKEKSRRCFTEGGIPVGKGIPFLFMVFL
jgi:hypothetical protein